MDLAVLKAKEEIKTINEALAVVADSGIPPHYIHSAITGLREVREYIARKNGIPNGGLNVNKKRN